MFFAVGGENSFSFESSGIETIISLHLIDAEGPRDGGVVDKRDYLLHWGVLVYGRDYPAVKGEHLHIRKGRPGLDLNSEALDGLHAVDVATHHVARQRFLRQVEEIELELYGFWYFLLWGECELEGKQLTWFHFSLGLIYR